MVIFVSVALVLILLILFFFFIIRGISFRLGKFAQLNVLRQSGVLDELIATKEQELELLTARIASAKEEILPQNLLAADREGVSLAYYTTPQATYKEEEFVGEYRIIREHFVPDRVEYVQEVLKELVPSETAVAAQEILSQLSLDTLYMLSTLPAPQQAKVLEQVLTPMQKTLLEEYLATAGKLESFEFYTWLKDYDFQHRAQVVVRTNAPSEQYTRLDKRITPMQDPSICEGVCIVAQGKLHDFSIRSREISG